MAKQTKANEDAERKVILASALTDSPTEISRLLGIPVSTVHKYRKKNQTIISEADDLRKTYDRESTKDAVEEITANFFKFIQSAAKTVNDPAKLEKASLKDIMTATGILIDKFPKILGSPEKEHAEQSGSGIIIQIVDNSAEPTEPNEGGESGP